MDENLDFSKNVDIQSALKEFETESQVQQLEKISAAPKVDNTSKMVRLFMKYSGGLIKEKKQAEYAIFGFVILAIIVSLFLFFYSRPKINLPPKSLVTH